MNNHEIKERCVLLCRTIFQNLSTDMELIEHVDFLDDLGMDSITFVSMIVEIEEQFSISIPDSILILDNFRNLNDIVEIITDIVNS